MSLDVYFLSSLCTTLCGMLMGWILRGLVDHEPRKARGGQR